MASTKLSDTLIGREVERLFGEISAKRGDLCANPVTGGNSSTGSIRSNGRKMRLTSGSWYVNILRCIVHRMHR